MARKPRARKFLMEPSAFLNDPAVLSMSTLARGAYSTLLLAMWDLPTPGIVPATDFALRALSRTTPEEWAEVKDCVSLAFDTESRPGEWVQKRMVQEHHLQDSFVKLQKARGKAGGKAKATKQLVAVATQALTPDCTQLSVLGSRFSVHKRQDKDLVTDVTGCVTVAEPAAKSRENGSRRGAKRDALAAHDPLPPGELTSDEVFFQVFWPEYPRKVARRAAEAAWKRLRLKDTDEETMVAIMAGLRRDIRGDWKGREPDKIPHASTWLHQRRWEG